MCEKSFYNKVRASSQSSVGITIPPVLIELMNINVGETFLVTIKRANHQSNKNGKVAKKIDNRSPNIG